MSAELKKRNHTPDDDDHPPAKRLKTQHVVRSVVQVRATVAEWSSVAPWKVCDQIQSEGSGFVIDGKRIVTNAHVVGKRRTTVSVKLNGQSTEYPARVTHISHHCDLAVLEVDDKEFHAAAEPLEIATEHEAPLLNERVVVCGYPVDGESISFTDGIVSRIEMAFYAESGTYLLTAQIDAVVNCGNSGGPVMHNGKVIGVAFQGAGQSKGISSIIPASVLLHMLSGREFATNVVAYDTLKSAMQRRYFKLPVGVTGVAVARLPPASETANVLQVGDVLHCLDGHVIDCHGKYEFRPSESMSFTHLISKRAPGDVIAATVYRQGEKLEIKLPCERLFAGTIAFTDYSKRPEFVMFAGLVFLPATYEVLQSRWSNSELPTRVAWHACQKDRQTAGTHTVILSSVLASEINTGQDSNAGLVLESCCGTVVKNVTHLAAIIDRAVADGAEQVSFTMENGSILAFDTKATMLSMHKIMEENDMTVARSLHASVAS